MESYDNFLLPHSSGIYCILNTETNDRYIGKARDIFVRCGQHKSLLRSNRHTYKTGAFSMLQKAWNKYGEKAFRFEVIELCSEEDASEREMYWIDFYRCNRKKSDHGYNATDGGDGATGNQNVKNRVQINNGTMQRLVKKNDVEMYLLDGYKKGLLPSTVSKIKNNRPNRTGTNNPNFGKTFSENTREKMRDAHLGMQSYWSGKHLSESHKKKIGDSQRGRTLPTETRQKISTGHKKPIVKLSKNGIYLNKYDSGLAAEQETGVNRAHISSCCKGKRKSAGGFIWRFECEYMGEV